MKVCRRVRHTSNSFTLYLHSPCLAVNKTTLFLTYFIEILAITTDNHCMYNVENFNRLPLSVLIL